MPSGSASRTQSLLDFTRPSQNNSTENIHDRETAQEQHPQKRPRTELEVPLVHVIMDEVNETTHNNPFVIGKHYNRRGSGNAQQHGRTNEMHPTGSAAQ